MIRTRVGDGPYGGHPQDYVSWFAHVPGLKVVVPATPADAKGLMIAAIRDDNPVLFVEPMSLAHARRAEVPDVDYIVPIGSASLARAGRDVTLVVWGSMLPLAMQAAATVSSEGAEVEIIDLRSLAPYDWNAIAASVSKTSRVIVVHEDTRSFGYGAELAARIASELFDQLDAPVGRIGALDTWVGYAPDLEDEILPQTSTITAEVERLLRY